MRASFLDEKQEIKKAVATSTEKKRASKLLQDAGVYEKMDAFVYGDEIKESKPDPEIYLYTAEKLGAEPGECLVIEDSTVGITAASRAGMKVAALIDNRFAFDRSLASCEIRTLTEIPALVRTLLGNKNTEK